MDTVNSIKNMTISNITTLIKESNDITINNINFSFLGKGGEGNVYKLGLLPIAMKIYRKKSHKNKEIYILKKLNLLSKDDTCNIFLKTHADLNMFGYPVLFMEIVDGSLENWVEYEHGYNEWICMIIQVLCGLVILQNKLKLFHTDMKPKNILFKKVDKYVINLFINNKNLSFESEYTFMISDFGHAQSLYFNDNKMEKTTIEENIKKNSDLDQLASFHKRLAVSIITKKYTLDEILEIAKDDDFFNSYVIWIKNEIEKDMSTYSPKIKNHMLVRDLSYYLLEKNYIDIEKLSNKTDNPKIFLPSKNIINVLESLKDINGQQLLKNKIIELGNTIKVNNNNNLLKSCNIIL